MIDKKFPNPWKRKSSKDIYENPWIKVIEDQVVRPNGSDGIYGRVLFKNKAIGIVPLDLNLNTWLVGQYRYTLNEYSWEIPMGGGPLNEDPMDTAVRELKEETGLTAGKLINIQRIHTSNSVTDEEGFIFLAQELEEGEPDFDETEDLKIWKLPFEEAFQYVIENKITDSISVAGILKVKCMIDTGEIS